MTTPAPVTLKVCAGRSMRRVNVPWTGVVTSTRRLRDWFRLRLWVRCWFCDYCAGPFVTRAEANAHLRHECRALLPE